MAITPNTEQFLEYGRDGRGGEVVMLDLLKFKERADDGAVPGRTRTDATATPQWR